MTGVRQALQVAKEISILTVACRQELLWVEGNERDVCSLSDFLEHSLEYYQMWAQKGSNKSEFIGRLALDP